MCTFYTVRWEGAVENETDRFFKRFGAIEKYKPYALELLSFVLKKVGDEYGALERLFNRFENEVVGLPNKGVVQLGENEFSFPGFPLRLYALRINNREDIVVLFNGGIK